MPKPTSSVPVLAVWFVLTLSPLGAQTVASTSWTAALARAAGAPSVVTLAPPDLPHPPEYEVKPSDLAAVKGADLVVYAGYEKFAPRLAETSGEDGVPTLKLVTDNTPAVLVAQARRVSEALGTQKAWQAWSAGFVPFTEGVKARVSAAWPAKRVVVQKLLEPWVRWLGFDVVGTFGPAEPSPAVVLQLVGLGPVLVIDNWHSPTGQAVAEALKAPRVELINFPGRDGTRSLEDVFTYNEKLLTGAVRKP